MKSSVRFASLLACTVLSFAAIPAHAGLITTPAGLNPGDHYRLFFVTSTKTNAQSTDIADYNAFVTSVANTQTELAALGTTWAAVGSTAAVDARDNTGTNPTAETGVPIYLLSGALLASNNADLWDGTLLTFPEIFEDGTRWVSGGSPTEVWTGTNADGTTSVPLGAGQPTWGAANASLGAWMNTAAEVNIAQFAMYAISGDLTVPVPVPATGLLLIPGLLGLLVWRRRSARSP
jgi:hypothetical protein